MPISNINVIGTVSRSKAKNRFVQADWDLLHNKNGTVVVF